MRRLLFACLCLPIAAQGPAGLAVVGTARPPFPVAATIVQDLDGDGKDEALVLGDHGEVRLLDPGNGALRGELRLPHPARSLVAVANLDGDARYHLVVFAPNGMQAYRYQDGAFATTPRQLLRRGRFTLRVGRPRIARLTQDVNRDGRPDLVIPGNTSCSLYLNRAGAADGAAEFSFTGRLELRITSDADTDAGSLARTLEHSIQIPDLRTADVNGDGRGDLVVAAGDRRLFHLQQPSGAFPAEPDIVLDLSRFRDTTPKAEVEFGRTLAREGAMLHTQDLDGDRIPDYIIAHRRKVWVYHGTDKGPQFDVPSKILILAEDVTFLLLMHLNDDAFPDLLVFKLQVPSLATLFLGLLADWDVKIRSVGYASEAGKTFARTPAWRSETILRVPSILSLIRNPEALVERFQSLGRKFRLALSTDLDADHADDVLMQSEDHKSLQYWLMDRDGRGGKQRADRRYRALLFEDENRVWDVERILGFIQSMADDRSTRMTHGRPASGGFTLRDPQQHRLEHVTPADFDGDGRHEIVLHYTTLAPPFGAILDILRLRP